MKRCVSIFCVVCCIHLLSWGQDSVLVSMPQDDVVQQIADTVRHMNKFQRFKAKITQSIKNKLNEPYDTTRNKGYWWRAMKHGKIDFNDSTMGYPKFVKFCWNAYKWGDHTFNSYDTAYVQGTGKNWKLIFKSDNWLDTYVGTPFKDVRMVMNSNLVSNVGVSLSFMAVSLGYSMNVSNLIHGENVSNKAEFSFVCSRFALDAYYWENRNKTNVIYTDESIDEDRHKFKQSGLSRKAMGLTAYYFFNNRRYSQAAAYTFSKYQKRSAGTWLAGISLQHFDVKFDVDKMPEEARYYIPTQEDAPRILYNDYCVLLGYAHNWVLGRKWLLNLTATPYIGYRYNHFHNDGNMESALSVNLRASVAAVYNHKQFFVGLQGFADHHRYKMGDSRLVNSTIDFAVLTGVRF
ncbi:MAG: DUF4421 domain-containing protein [Muribaculaceae bacterium]|nr:DUF4421 domain-containing protein [Muribaculaceae bacterium]